MVYIKKVPDLVQSKVFTFDVYSEQEYVYVKVYLLDIPLPKFTTKIGQTLQKVFQTFYNIGIQGMYICIKIV